MRHTQFAPQDLPLLPPNDLGQIAPERLSAKALRKQFLDQPEWTPEVLSSDAFMPSDLHSAAVLIPIAMHESGPTVLFTQRAQHLNKHAGQISFPGGRCELYDGTPQETALRESEEEIGLSRSAVEVLGCLPEYTTGTGYLVTPVTALIKTPIFLQSDPSEVERTFEVPLAFLMDSKNHEKRVWQSPDGHQREFYAMPYREHFIWGATAGMLRNLFHFLRAS